MHLKNHRIVAVGRHAHPLGYRPFADRRHVCEPHQTRGTRAEDRVADLLEAENTRVGHGEIKLIMIFQAAHRLNHVSRR